MHGYRAVASNLQAMVTKRCRPLCCVYDSYQEVTALAKEFVYISHTRLEMKGGMRHAYLGEVAEPVVYGVQGALREYYRVPHDASSMASTLDHIVAAVGG